LQRGDLSAQRRATPAGASQLRLQVRQFGPPRGIGAGRNGRSGRRGRMSRTGHGRDSSGRADDQPGDHRSSNNDAALASQESPSATSPAAPLHERHRPVDRMGYAAPESRGETPTMSGDPSRRTCGDAGRPVHCPATATSAGTRLSCGAEQRESPGGAAADRGRGGCRLRR
jgi:hypothetical protein